MNDWGSDLERGVVWIRNVDREKDTRAGGLRNVELAEVGKINWMECNKRGGDEKGEEKSTTSKIRGDREKISHVLRGDSHLRTIIEGRKRERPKQMLLDWMMMNSHSRLEEEAQHRKEWCRWTPEPARRQRT